MKQYIVDAFTDKIFSGNQAAVCVMDSWPDEKLMMNIARENNFSETAFTVKEGNNYRLRWFTPGGEIDLCGHATLASAYVLMRFYEDTDTIIFSTISGNLRVNKQSELYAMNFPAYDLVDYCCTSLRADIMRLTAYHGALRPNLELTKTLYVVLVIVI